MYIIIPSYEPDQRLVDLVTELKKQLPAANLLVVNDGSGPNYQEYFRDVAFQGATVLEHLTNKGKGAALKTAFKFIQQYGKQDVMITVDSDGQHLVPDIIRVAEGTQEAPDTITLGSRSFVGKVPLRSRFGNHVTALLFRLVTGLHLTDTQTGLRGLPTDLIPWLLVLKGDRFEYEFNMLLEAKKAGYRIQEVAIETIYLEDNKSSHFRPIKDSLRIYAPFLKFSGTALLAAMIDAVVLFIMMAWSNHLLLSVILARVLSALTQCLLNANFVFHNTSHLFRTMIRYGILVVVILACNYVLMSSLLTVGIGLFLAKLVTETLLFLVSYRVQQSHVFV